MRRLPGHLCNPQAEAWAGVVAQMAAVCALFMCPPGLGLIAVFVRRFPILGGPGCQAPRLGVSLGRSLRRSPLAAPRATLGCAVAGAWGDAGRCPASPRAYLAESGGPLGPMAPWTAAHSL